MSSNDVNLSLVVPVLNEESSIAQFYDSILNMVSMQPDLAKFEIVFIDDGSSDKTAELIKNLCEVDLRVKLVEFSRNFGKEAAILAGLRHTTGEMIIPIDVDLQDPVEVIPSMVEEYRMGYDVILPKRHNRSKDTFGKRITASAFYKVMNYLADQKIPENVGDFRLMSRAVVDAILSLPENQLFMKGVFAWVGFNQRVFLYERRARVSGQTKFNVSRLWSLAVQGITSFSTLPLKLWTFIGLFFSLCAFVWAVKIFIETVLFGNPVAGYPSLMVAILFMGGIQLIGIGILGEYLGRTYMEAKRRPRYIIKKLTGFNGS